MRITLFNFKRLFSFSFILFSLFLVLAGCSQKKDVAVIDGEGISLPYFLYTRNSQFEKKSLETQKEELQEFYATLLRAHDAEERGLQNDPDIKYSLQESQRSIIVDALFNSEIVDKILSDELLKKTYNKMKEKRKVSRLLITYGAGGRSDRTKQEAEELITQIKDQITGTDSLSFEDAVLKYSDDTRTKNQGGDMGYLGYSGLPKKIQQVIWNLSPGEVSDPVEMRYGYFLIKLTGIDSTKIGSFSESKARIKNVLQRSEVDSLRSAWENLREEIMKETNSVMDDSAFSLLADRLFSKYSEQEGSKPNLVSLMDQIDYISPGTMYGEEITPEQFKDILHLIDESNYRRIPDKSSMRKFLWFNIQSNVVAQYAREHNIDNYDDTGYKLRWDKAKSLNTYYKKHVVLVDFPPSEDTLRAYFDRVKMEQYTTPDTVHVLEIYVSDIAHAQELKSQLDAGADFAPLAAKETTRPGFAEKSGDLGWFSTDRYGDIGTTAANMAVGEISDPIQVGTGWSIIKLMDKKKGITRSFDTVKSDVKQKYIAKYQPLRIEQNIQSLEEKYNGEIHYSALQDI